MLYECNTCHKTIDWDREKRQAAGTNKPLNPDGTIHTHTAADFERTTTTTTDTMPPTDKTQGTTPQNGKPITVDDTTNKDLANRVAFLNERVTWVENELRKLKEWLAAQPMK